MGLPCPHEGLATHQKRRACYLLQYLSSSYVLAVRNRSQGSETRQLRIEDCLGKQARQLTTDIQSAGAPSVRLLFSVLYGASAHWKIARELAVYPVK